MSDAAGPLVEDLEDLYENAPCGYLSVRPDGLIFKSNVTIAAWLGFGPGELIGRRLHDLLTIAGRIFYETGPAHVQARLADFLDQAMARHELRREDPGIAAAQFFTSPDLWVGLLVAAGFVAAAVWMRRRGEPI